jgi:glycosyltransferase involved in cell wall biosynthesis
MILFLHNRYRVSGGEERTVEDLLWLVKERLGEQALLLSRESAEVGRARAATALLCGGQRPQEVGAMISRSGARVLHAHNLQPLFGWRALQAARKAGAKVVLHLHQYRLVCAVGVCFTDGSPCTRCHGRNTLPGVVHNCRGSRLQAASYATALALWQRRVIELADLVIVPSLFARERLRELGAPIDFDRVHVLAPPLRDLQREQEPYTADGGYALIASRLAPEKGIDVAIDACMLAGRRLLIAGDGPERERLRHQAQRAPTGQVKLLGPVSQERLARLRARAALALMPSRCEETFGIAAAEAMAAGMPVLGSDLGALRELLEAKALVPAGDVAALASGIDRLWADAQAGARNRERVAEVCAPELVASRLAKLYDAASPL